MKNAKQELQGAFSQLQQVQCSLKQALNTVEKENNKHQLQNTLSFVDEAIFAASNALSNYQE